MPRGFTQKEPLAGRLPGRRGGLGTTSHAITTLRETGTPRTEKVAELKKQSNLCPLASQPQESGSPGSQPRAEKHIQSWLSSSPQGTAPGVGTQEQSACAFLRSFISVHVSFRIRSLLWAHSVHSTAHHILLDTQEVLIKGRSVFTSTPPQDAQTHTL